MKNKILIYGIGTFFSKILVFLMFFIYARVFPKSDLGYYDVLITDMQMIVSIAFIEIWSGIIRFMFDMEDKYKPIKAVMHMMPVLIVIYAACVFAFSLFFEVKYPIITIIYGIMYLLFCISNSVCRGLEKNAQYIISGIISTFVSCAFSLIFAVGMHLGIKYLLLAQCIGYLVAVIYVEGSIKAFRNSVKTIYDPDCIRSMSLYSIPLMINSMSFLFLETYNKNMIIKLLGEQISGIAAFVGKFSAIIAVLLSVYGLAWQEQAFIYAHAINNDQHYSYYLNEFVKLIGLGIPIYIMICVVFSPIYGGAQYYGSEIYIPLAILSSYIANFSGMIGTVIAVKKKTNYILLSTIVGAVLNVIIASCTIKHYGLNASAMSLCISFSLTAFLRLYFAGQSFDLHIKWSYLALMVIEIAFILAALYIFGSNLVLNLIIAAVLMTIWLIVNIGTIRSIIHSVIVRLKKGRENS